MSAQGIQWWCSAKGGVWTWSWRPYPGVWLFIAGTGVGYLARWRRARVRRSRERRAGAAPTVPAAGMRPLAAAAGILLLWIALDWPVGPLGAGYLEAVHMVQFLLVVMLAPPLLIHGLPPAAAYPAPRSWPRRALTHPVAALALSSTLIVTGHTPFFVDTLMASQVGSLVLDLVWLAAGLLLWWPLLSPREDERLPAGPLALIYLFVGLLPDKGIGIWLLLSRWPQYRIYELAPPVHGISANVDQGIAGGLMLVAGMLILLAAIGVVVQRWSRAADVEAALRRVGPAPAPSGVGTTRGAP